MVNVVTGFTANAVVKVIFVVTMVLLQQSQLNHGDYSKWLI